jgi:hypothetical protein
MGVAIMLVATPKYLYSIRFEHLPRIGVRFRGLVALPASAHRTTSIDGRALSGLARPFIRYYYYNIVSYFYDMYLS